MLEEADFSVGYELEGGGLATHDSSHVYAMASLLINTRIYVAGPYSLCGPLRMLEHLTFC